MLTLSDLLMIVYSSTFIGLALWSQYSFKQTGARGHLTAALALIVAFWANLLLELLDYFDPPIGNSLLVPISSDVVAIATVLVISFWYLQFNIDFNHHLGWRGFINLQLGFYFYSRKHLGSKEHNATKAITYFSKALEVDPDVAAIHSYRGFAWTQLDKIDKALADYAKSLTLDPTNPDTWINRGICLGKLGRHEEAVKDYERAIEVDPLDPIAWTNKGCSLGELNKNVEALGAFDKALELDPEVALTWKNKAISLIRLSRYGEAVKALNRAVLLDSDDAESWSMKGRALDMLGKSAEASKSFDRAQRLETSIQSE